MLGGVIVKRSFKNMALIIISIYMIFTLAACNSFKKEPIEIPKVEPEETVETLSKEEQDSIMKGYYQILAENSHKEDIISYIDDNIKKLDRENAESMIVSLENFLASTNSSMEEDYSLLSRYTEYVSAEMQSYLHILELETGNSFTDGEILRIDMDEILDRALDAEKHLNDFQDGKTSRKIYELYIEYIKASMIGTGNQYIFAEEGNSKIKDEYLEIYKSIIEDNSNTNTADILSQYVKILEENQGDMNSEDVNRFYDEIELIIKEHF